MKTEIKVLPRSLSPIYLRKGYRRPAVLSLTELLGIKVSGIFDDEVDAAVRAYQDDNGLEVDGIVGPKTWQALVKKRGVPSLLYRMYEWVCWVEVGTKGDAFGFAENDIGDDAGANYGVIQYNGMGSMERLLKKNNPELLDLYKGSDRRKVVPEIKDWIGSPEGIEAQLEDFSDHIVSKSVKDMGDLGLDLLGDDPVDQRAQTLFVDFVVQNGGPISPYRTAYIDVFSDALKSYVDDKTRENLVSELSELGRDKSVVEANENITSFLIDEAGDRVDLALVYIAAYRGACSRRKYAHKVVARKLAIATGYGAVHGGTVDLRNQFGIG